MRIAFEGGEIRPWHPSDRDELARLADNPEVWRGMLEPFPDPYTRRAARIWIREAAFAVPISHFAIEAGGKVAGGIGLKLGEGVRAGTAEIGYWLGEAFWGRGLMTAALRAFSDRAFGSFRLRRIHANILEGNAASLRVLAKAGFVLEGRLRESALKDGRIRDQLIMARLAGAQGP